MRLLGLDPGLRVTGWGAIEVEGNRLVHIGHGTVRPPTEGMLAERLAALYRGLARVVASQEPDEAAVEETFVNRNPASALRLGHARGVVLLAPAEVGVPVCEYPANLVKKALVGAGHADKVQVAAMVAALLPGSGAMTPDAADALAVAICHAHHRRSQRRWRAAGAESGR